MQGRGVHRTERGSRVAVPISFGARKPTVEVESSSKTFQWVEFDRTKGRCIDDPDAMFVQGAAQNIAKQTCRTCPIKTECLAEALDNREEFGVRGGMTERERRALLRRHPQVVSWRKLFQRAQENQSLSA